MDSAPNVLGGDDTISAANGADVVIGGEGADTITNVGDTGADLTGIAPRDEIFDLRIRRCNRF